MNNHITPSLFYHLMRVDCDLIHAHDGFFFGTLVAFIVSKIRGKPFIVTHHSNLLRYSNPLKKLIQYLYLNLILKTIYKGSSNVIALNDVNKRILNSWGVFNVSVVPAAIHPQPYRSCDHACVSRLRSKYDIKDNEVVLLFVGRFVENKGIVNLIDVFREVLRNTNKVRLVLVGDGPLKSKVDGLVRDYKITDKVIMLGSTPFEDVTPLYHLADILVLPSFVETQPTVVFESILAGTPVVASDLPVLHDIVVPDKTGFLSEVGDTKAMAEIIVGLVNDNPQLSKLKNSCRGFDLSKHYWENVIDDFTRLYHQAVK